MQVIKESNGRHKGVPIHCPTYAIGDCPYCAKNGICHIADPTEDCDDFLSYWSTWEEWEEEYC